MNRKPLILISNDDGITSNGIRYLVNIVKELGEPIVVAPNSPQSASGHSITINEPIKYYRSNIFDTIEAYECSGTPADCIKLAKHHLFKNRTIDLVVSGINHGSNTSVSVLYSGTMSAAIEASIENLPAIGFSLCNYSMNADFSHTLPYIQSIIKKVLSISMPKGISLNVNLPSQKSDPIKGIRVCRQAMGRWKENFDERRDPQGRRYLWLMGEFINEDMEENTDEWAIKNNYVSIVPTTFDITAYNHMNKLSSLDW